MKKLYRLLFRSDIVIFILALQPFPLWALSSNPPQSDSDYGAFIGNLLPHQIEGVTEITPQWGLKASFRSSGNYNYYEISGTGGKGNGAEWSSLNLSFRMDMQLETITGFVFVGADLTRFRGEGYAMKSFGGGHVGGGILTHIGDALWFRTEMKFNVNPGTSLFINAGFVFRFGVDSDSSATGKN